MPSIEVKGLKGISPAMRELATAISTTIPERSISYSGQQTKQRLEQDTPVITGRLKRSTVFRKDSATHAVVGQFAAYAAKVEQRRHYWEGARRMADLWPNLFKTMVGEEIGIISRKYAGK